MVRFTMSVRCAHCFYVVQHPWLAAFGYVKVGYTRNPWRRLNTVSFTTCFTPEWSYFSVFECEGIKEAFLLEQAVLYVFEDVRVSQRELIKCDPQPVVDVARRICDKLNLNALLKAEPEYHLNTNGSLSPTGSQTDKSVGQTVEELQSSTCILRGHVEKLKELRDSMRDDGFFSSYLGSSGMQQEESKDNITAEESECVFSDEEGVDALTDEEVEGELDYDFEDLAAPDEAYTITALRPYQAEAVDRCLAELERSGAALCQMACRCGKTPVAFKIIQHYIEKVSPIAVLFLVPSLGLLRQTVKKLYGYGLRRVNFLLIGSCAETVMLDDGYALTMTTDAETIKNTISSSTSQLVVISTYHSSHIVCTMTGFNLAVFDECHRVCGSATPTNFNSVLLHSPCKRKLFLTATPAYNTPLRMDQVNLFGNIAYRYYLREGIDAGYVNPFSLRIILGEGMEDMNPYFFEAMKLVDKMIVYCGSIKHATELKVRLGEPPPGDVKPFVVLLAHSKMPSAVVSDVLRKFTVHKRCILLNVRLFQEGIEIPDLNAVFFAAPRRSPRDIVQSICRPLNKMDGKPSSYVFLPATIDKKLPADHPVNLEKFSELVPFTDALMDEDPVFFEYLIDPQKVSYDIDVVGVRSLELSSGKIRKFVLPALRRGVRYTNQGRDRLHRATSLPWKAAFGELKRIVLECNRYPKNNDAWVIGERSISMMMFLKFVRKGYQQYLDGKTSSLQMYQIRDLESLPLWKTYGLHGPYPWEECMHTLQRYLERHGHVPPLDVHKGGYVGLDATPLERLCGALMNVNQHDGHDRMTLDPRKQLDLDKICLAHGLKWRRRRDSDGKALLGEKTFISESYAEFKRKYEEGDTAFLAYVREHFPGYPEKHERMEDPRNLNMGRVPPRHVSRGALEDARVEEKVMCRICRKHIPLRLWERHLTTRAHQSKLGRKDG
ncbi:helicase-like protein [Trypanosoma vivax]|nr:helicase-like protein [Trypanosoma vivax]